MGMPLLEVNDVTVRFGGIVALSKLSFEISEGTICGLIGPNGAGKTTLFNVVSRLYQPTTGRVVFDGHDVLDVPAHRVGSLGIARTFQNLALWPGLTVLDNVMVGAHTRGRQNFVTAALGVGTRREDAALAERCYGILADLGLAPVAFRPAGGLPFGTLKRIELARALASSPKLLMLDEPASGLTQSEVGALGELVLRLRDEHALTILLVEHHMALVMGISDQVVVLDFGRQIAVGTPAEVSRHPDVIAAYLGGEP
jgi:branched-chain amino acid transport system ATP-binding protein